MIGYILRRLLHAAFVVFIVSIVVFGLLHALPGGLARAQLGLGAKRLQVHELEVQEGLLKPLPIQYLIWAWHALQGHLGFSYKLNLANALRAGLDPALRIFTQFRGS